MNANKKLYGKDLSEYENMDLDELLDQLTPEEVDILTKDVDPDVSTGRVEIDEGKFDKRKSKYFL